uniref:hypothetical protein n=1 Tax=Acetatifactor sp. TaxID=1872090 RepID=UPI004057052B
MERCYGDDILQDGQYIVDRIMLDFYCMMDGPNHGMTVEQMTERYGTYCASYNIQVDMGCLKTVNPNICRQCLENGYLLLFAGNFTMYFGKYQPSHVKGWHIMNISDVADDGTVTVISWGR